MQESKLKIAKTIKKHNKTIEYEIMICYNFFTTG